MPLVQQPVDPPVEQREAPEGASSNGSAASIGIAVEGAAGPPETKTYSLIKLSARQEVLDLMAKIYIEYQDIHGYWKQYQTKNNERDAYRTANARAQQTGKRHRIVDEGRRVLDICG